MLIATGNKHNITCFCTAFHFSDSTSVKMFHRSILYTCDMILSQMLCVCVHVWLSSLLHMKCSWRTLQDHWRNFRHNGFVYWQAMLHLNLLIFWYASFISFVDRKLPIWLRNIVLNISRYTDISAEISVFYSKQYDKCKNLPDIVLDRYVPIYRHVADISADIEMKYPIYWPI